MKKIKFLPIAILFAYLPMACSAWGLLGHRIIGEIADGYLTRHARKEIKKILGDESIAITANWADFIKSDPDFKYLTPWHYADLHAGMSFNQFSEYFTADTAVDAYTKINFLVNELKHNRQNLTPAATLMYLRLLIHIVGDIHQPLHVGHVEDRGGNDIKVRWFSEEANIHQVWDGRLIDFQQLSYTEYTASINHCTKEQREIWQKQPLMQWMWDSYALSEKIYADVTPGQKLGYEYNYKYIALLNERLLEGGVHLAGLLNDIFG